MKLNGKFSLIVVITVVQVLFLTYFSVNNSKQIQQIKEYQNVQTKTQVELGKIIDYLDKMDYWGFDISTAYSAFDKNKDSITQLFNYQFESPLLKSFPENFVLNLNQIKGIWGLLCDCFTPLEGILQEMEEANSRINSSISLNIKYYGIRDTDEVTEPDEELAFLVELVTQGHEEIKKVRKQYESLNLVNAKSSLILEEVLETKESQFMLISMIMAAISCIILTVLILIVTKSVSRRILKIKNVTSTLAEKDFSKMLNPEGSDEMFSLMENINNMVEQINEFFNLVKATARKASDSGSSIIETANSTSQATNEIDASIDKINSDFNEVVSVINGVVDIIAEMNLHVETLEQNNAKQTYTIEETNKSMAKVVETLGHMNVMALERVKIASEIHSLLDDGDEKITSTNKILNEVEQELDEVYKVVEIINKVAKQTNLLSMNAAIESVHAGEAGKGFAVVAEEIRALAEETSRNASQISGVINKMVNAVGNANTISQSASQAFTKVSSHADQIVGSLNDITNGIGQIDDQMNQMKIRSEEIVTVADQINSYCGTLVQKQKQVSSSVDELNNQLFESIKSLHDIKNDTAEIVDKMKDVTNASEESFKNMSDLGEVLQDFKTQTLDTEFENFEESELNEEKMDSQIPSDFDEVENVELDSDVNTALDNDDNEIEDLTTLEMD